MARFTRVQVLSKSSGVVAQLLTMAGHLITSDPIVIDIRQKFLWLKPLEDKGPGNDIIYLPKKLGINRYHSIFDASCRTFSGLHLA
jgi:hypothetical protein